MSKVLSINRKSSEKWNPASHKMFDFWLNYLTSHKFLSTGKFSNEHSFVNCVFIFRVKVHQNKVFASHFTIPEFRLVIILFAETSIRMFCGTTC